jgi:hypothetical protein
MADGPIARATRACDFSRMNTWRMVATPILVLLLAVMPPIAMAQLPGLSSAGDAPAAEPTDRMGRGTPRGTIVAFSRAAQREDFIAAARYCSSRGRNA